MITFPDDVEANPVRAFDPDFIALAASLPPKHRWYQEVCSDLAVIGVPKAWADAVAHARRVASEPDEEPNDTLRWKLTPYGNAERLVARYGDRIRYCPPHRSWLVWDGSRWRWDETGVVVRLAKKVVRSIYTEVKPGHPKYEKVVKHALASEKTEQIRGMIELAGTERGIPVMPLELDADPWLLNCKNGTLDLKTGELRPHDRRDLITKSTGVDFDPDAEHETWFRYLVDATGGDAELAAFLRRVAGYALIGEPLEKSFFFVYGPPDSTKSTFIDAITAALGDYAVASAFSTWCVQSNTGGNRGDLVRLAGARLVTSVEIKKGAKFDEEIVKSVTGGDAITAAAKFKDDITFRPSFTLLLAANDAPAIRDDDEGMWNRCNRLPFLCVPRRKDPAVKRTLTSVARPAVLAWAVRGCLEYQRRGIGSASAVERSTSDYRAENDRFAGFAADCLAFEEWDDARASRPDVKAAYLAWAKENNIRFPLTPAELYDKLRAAGATEGKIRGSLFFKRVRLLSAAEVAGGATGGNGGQASPKGSLRESLVRTSGEDLPPAAPTCPPHDNDDPHRAPSPSR